jgi:hypothetical protein
MKQMIGVNASADLSNYREKGDRLWYKLINLAREYNNQEAEMSFKQEKESFDEMAIKMGHNITVDIYGN